MPGEVVRPVSAARNGCATAPSLTPLALGEGAHGLSVASAVQGSTAASSAATSRQQRRALPASAALSPCRRAGSAGRRRENARRR